MTGAGDRKTPKLPAFLVEARDRRASKRPVYKPAGRNRSSHKVDIDDPFLLAGGGGRWSGLAADDLLIRVFIVTVGILYMAMGGFGLWVLLAQSRGLSNQQPGLSAWIVAVFLLVIGVLQLVRCFLPQYSLLVRAGETFGPQRHPFKGNWLYWIPLGPAVLITLLLRLVGVTGRPLRETNLLPQPDPDAESDPFWDDLTIRSYSFVVGIFFAGIGCVVISVPLLEKPDPVIFWGSLVVAAFPLLYGLSQLNRALGSADTRVARWAEKYGPARAYSYDSVDIVIGILAIPVMFCLAAAGVGQRRGERAHDEISEE